jgi:hypothetical protein
MLRTAKKLLERLKLDHAGAVGVVAAFALPATLAMASLVAEYGHALVVKTQDQRVADAAAYAGALAYNTTSSQATMISAAKGIASLNGVAASGVTATLVNSPTGDGNQAVQAQVTSSVPLFLAQIFGAKATMPVSATSYAELSAQVNPCVIALSSSGAGVTLSGGTSLSATKCSVGSNNTLTVPCGTTIFAVSVSYAGATPSQKCGGIESPTGGPAPLVKKSSADPLAGSTAVKTLSARVTTDLGLVGPSVPSGPDLDFNSKPAKILSALSQQNCTGVQDSSGNWTVDCSSGTHNFGLLNVQGATTVNFAVNSSSSNTYTFSGPVTVSGSGVLVTGGGSFTLAQGLSTSGGTVVRLGSGTANSFQIGPNSKGSAINIGGGGSLFLADATGSASVFQVVGDITSNGGTCVQMSAAAQHDIDGSIDMSGAVILGSGVYTVTGYVALGGNNGGNVTCNGSSVGLLGNNVVLVIGGQPSYPNGNCAGQALCIGAGYQTVTLTGPTSGPYAGLVVVGPQTNNAGALFTAGASGTSISGAFYFPKGSISLQGGAALGGGTGQCLEIIGSQVTLQGGTAAASNCISSTSSATASVTLVQ